MARTPSTAPAKTETAETAAPAPDETVFSWETLPDAEVVEYHYATPASSFDWEAETPAVIKARVSASYDAYRTALKEETDRIFKANGNGPLSEAQEKRATLFASRECARVQVLPNLKMAEEFAKFARGYANFRGWTIRGLKVDESSTVQKVEYRVKDKETRARS